MPIPKNEPATGRKKKTKQPTQKTPMQRVMVLGGVSGGRIRWEWRPW